MVVSQQLLPHPVLCLCHLDSDPQRLAWLAFRPASSLWPCWGTTRLCLSLITVSGPDTDPDLPFPHPGSLLVQRLLPPAFSLCWAHSGSNWTLLAPGTSSMILALPASPLPVRTTWQNASDFIPLAKSNLYHNTHFLSKYHTIDFIRVFSNISLNRKKKKKEWNKNFLSLKNTSTIEEC